MSEQAKALITQHMDLWSSAITSKQTTGRGSNKKIELYGIKKLRDLILVLAVRGKLVPQDPSDEPASELLKRVAQEKSKLVKEKKITKPKKLPPVSKEEFSWSLPNSWECLRFGDFFELEYGNNLPKTKRTESGEYPVFGSNGVVGSHNECSIEHPCIVVGRKGSAGALNLCLEQGCWVTDVAYSLIPPSDIDINYCLKLLHTLGLDELGKGIKPGLNRNEAYVIPVAIPPVAEQHRIVAKVDELMALCDQLENQTEHSLDAHAALADTLLGALTQAESCDELLNNWRRLEEHWDILFPSSIVGIRAIDKLKQTILQLAVMGKLVPQDQNDEPASELLKRFAAGKEQLIKDKNIKKPNPLLPITDDEKPFKLPEGWSFARFGSILELEYGDNLPRARRSNSGEYSVYGSNGVVGSHHSASVEGSCVVVGRKGSAGALNLCIGSGCWVTDVAYSLAPPKELDLIFTFKLLHTLGLNNLGKGIKPGLNRNEVNILVIAVPPLEEQKRIIAKVEELTTLCDQIIEEIHRVLDSQLSITDAVSQILVGRNQTQFNMQKEELAAMKIVTDLTLGPIAPDESAIIASLIDRDEGAADAKAIWSKTKLSLPKFYEQLKREIEAGYINKPPKASVEG